MATELTGEQLHQMVSRVASSNIPSEMGLAETLLYSIAKWHPMRGERRGFGFCALCMWAKEQWLADGPLRTGARCDVCPYSCFGDSPWDVWSDLAIDANPEDTTPEEINEAADKVYRELVALHKKTVDEADRNGKDDDN